MDREAIKALVDQAYEARRTEDMEGIMAVFHPEGKFEFAGSREHTAAEGLARGR